MLSNDITLGNALTLVTTLLALWKFHINSVERLTRIETRLEALWEERNKTRKTGWGQDG